MFLRRLMLSMAVFFGHYGFTLNSFAGDDDATEVPTAPRGPRPPARVGPGWPRIDSALYNAGVSSYDVPSDFPLRPNCAFMDAVGDLTYAGSNNILASVINSRGAGATYVLGFDGTMHVFFDGAATPDIDKNSVGAVVRAGSEGRRVFADYYQQLRGTPYDYVAIRDGAESEKLLQIMTQEDGRLLKIVADSVELDAKLAKPLSDSVLGSRRLVVTPEEFAKLYPEQANRLANPPPGTNCGCNPSALSLGGKVLKYGARTLIVVNTALDAAKVYYADTPTAKDDAFTDMATNFTPAGPLLLMGYPTAAERRAAKDFNFEGAWGGGPDVAIQRAPDRTWMGWMMGYPLYSPLPPLEPMIE